MSQDIHAVSRGKWFKRFGVGVLVGVGTAVLAREIYDALATEETEMPEQYGEVGEMVVDSEEMPIYIGMWGYDEDDEGYVVDENGDRVESTRGEPIQMDNIGYADDLGEDPVFVPDHISDLVRYFSDREYEQD